MDKKDFRFLRDFPELGQLVHQVASEVANPYFREHLNVLIEIVYRAGMVQGIDHSLSSTGLRTFKRPPVDLPAAHDTDSR